ncbi:MAG: HAD family hydrolase [Coriobacteriia bacterium]
MTLGSASQDRGTSARTLQAVLFDLDGTLLENHMEVFLPHYFRLLSTEVAEWMPPKVFIEHLLRATNAMIENDRSRRNVDAFEAAFYPLGGKSRDELAPLFDRFYVERFPSLRQYTQAKPEARLVVQRAFDLGYAVVIATNPLFPARAVTERLEWAEVADFPYRLVTSYENSSAAKPNPQYFEEIAETLGVPLGACLVVGDEAADMVSASVGCTTFLVPGPATHLDPDVPAPAYRGTLGEVIQVLERGH